MSSESLSESIEAGRPTSFLVALTWEDLGTSSATPSSPPLRPLAGVALDGDAQAVPAVQVELQFACEP